MTSVVHNGAKATELSGLSSMMPQKRNPTVLELPCFCSSHGVSLAQNVANIQVKSHYADVRECDRSWKPTFMALDNATDTMWLFGATVSTMLVNKDRMLELARGGRNESDDTNPR